MGSWISIWTSCASLVSLCLCDFLPHPCCPWIRSSPFLFLFVLLSLHNLYGPRGHLNAHCWGYFTIAMSCWTFRSPLHLLKRRADVALFHHVVGTDICVCRLFPTWPTLLAIFELIMLTRNNGAFKVCLLNYLCDHQQVSRCSLSTHVSVMTASMTLAMYYIELFNIFILPKLGVIIS